MPGMAPVTDPAEGGASKAVWMLVAIGSGACLALQARATGQLTEVIGEPLLAAAFNFALGWVIVSLILLAPAPRAGVVRSIAASRAGSLPFWALCSGMFGAVFMVGQAIGVPIVGVAMFTIGVVAGQTANALLVDRAGLGPAGRTAVSPGRVVAAAVAFAGVAVGVSGRVGASLQENLGALLLLPMLAAIIGGAATTVSAAGNGRVAVGSRNLFATTWFNFTSGLTMLIVLVAAGLGTGLMHYDGLGGAPWWAYFGGVVGGLYVITSAAAVRHVGVLLLMLGVLTGQMATALVLDLAAASTRHLVTLPLVAGVLITALAALGAAAAASGKLRFRF